MKITRRLFIKKTFQSAFGMIGLSGLSYYYSRYVEPYWLNVQTYTVNNSKIPHSFHRLSILQFSDTHLGFHYDLKQFEKLVQLINNHKPDLILFTGDLVDEPQTYHFTNELPQLLNQIRAPLGKFWVFGNHDHGGYGTEKIKSVMENGGFHLLQNNQVDITYKNETISVAGMDDVMLGKPDIEKTMQHVKHSTFSILMVHEPDGADRYQYYYPDIQLSGHSHGGQVQLPIYGYLITPPMAEKYVEGYYQLEEGMELFVSRGVGTTRMPYRFLCRPEVSIFHLNAFPI